MTTDSGRSLLRDRARPHGPWLAVVRAVGRGFGLLPRVLAAGASLGWMLSIWWLSSGPIDVRMSVPASDFLWNLAHAPVFGLLAALVSVAAAPRPLPSGWPHPGRLACLVALLAVAAWAAIDELHQARSGRHGSAFDVATDLTGAACVLWLACYAGRSGADERGMRRRILVGLGACAAAAALTTVADRFGTG
jgi:VanZ family protein